MFYFILYLHGPDLWLLRAVLFSLTKEPFLCLFLEATSQFFVHLKQVLVKIHWRVPAGSSHSAVRICHLVPRSGGQTPSDHTPSTTLPASVLVGTFQDAFKICQMSLVKWKQSVTKSPDFTSTRYICVTLVPLKSTQISGGSAHFLTTLW